MTVYCQKSFKLRVARFTQLNECGAVVTGAASTVVTSGLVGVTLTPVYETPTAYLVKNANDELEVNEEGQPRLKWWQASIEMINVDPYAITTTLGWPLVTDAAGNVTGWRSREDLTSQFALEGWTYLSGDTCQAGARSYGYRLLPFLYNAMITGDIKLANEVATLTVQAHTHAGAQWGVGPYNVVLNALGVAAPLPTPIAAGDHLHVDRTTVAPPTATCGAVALA